MIKLKSLIFESITLKKIQDFNTSEGRFTVYDVDDNHRDRPDMFTVIKSSDGYVVRNAYLPDNLTNQGIGTNFYIQMNKESMKKTGHPLRSSPPRKLFSGETIIELSIRGVKLWDSLVRKGLAKKIGDRQYTFI